MKKEDIIQITEEQAINMLWHVSLKDELCKGEPTIIIDTWKEEGYIKKSALEEARDYYSDYIVENTYCNEGGTPVIDAKRVKTLQECYEIAIEELKKNE